jgi:hypothetical protein
MIEPRHNQKSIIEDAEKTIEIEIYIIQVEIPISQYDIVISFFSNLMNILTC